MLYRSYFTKILSQRTASVNNVYSVMASTRIGVLQLSVTENKEENFRVSERYILESVSQGAKMVFLPECFDFISPSRDFTISHSESLDGPLLSKYKAIAAANNVWISLGGAHRKVNRDGDDDRICNTHIVIDSDGNLAGIYDKVHLFDVNLPSMTSADDMRSPGRLSVSESKYVRRGDGLPPVIRNTPVGSLGLAICYDLRFPELAAHLRYAGGAHVLAYPSAFSLPTGHAGHWHILLRARAIENQCYVIAAAQEGIHNPKRSSYGHSLVVDPWGQIVAEKLDAGPGLLLCDIGLASSECNPDSHMCMLRESVPVEFHRRSDLFHLPEFGLPQTIGSSEFRFGPHSISANCVFYRSALSFAFVNISPLVPGHVLVSPIHPYARFADLTRGHVADLYLTVKAIAPLLMSHFSAKGLTISIQDGKDAGQNVPHVHVHVLPRKPGDFARNDDIYQALQKHEKVPTRVCRSVKEMISEAAELRPLFYHS